jgi:hypothetical protein
MSFVWKAVIVLNLCLGLMLLWALRIFFVSMLLPTAPLLYIEKRGSVGPTAVIDESIV